MTTRLTFVGLMALLILGFLAACGDPPPPPPADATVNGVTSIDRATGEVEFSVSALDQEGELLNSGSLSDVTATVDQPGFTAEGNVCGNGYYRGQRFSNRHSDVRCFGLYGYE